mgnify:CR=1 FL=1
MAENTEDLKECQLCHQMLHMSSFYKRKDRDGEHNWKRSYCEKCDVKINSISRAKNPEHYREYYKQQGNKYYHNNKDKVRIIQRRYYYNNLPSDKKEIYKLKLQNKYPDIVDKICIK